MITQGRNWTSGSGEEYRFGFNGKENTDEIYGDDNAVDFGERIYDARLGRWLSVDKLSKNYPAYSNYCFALNTPIQAVDPDGRLVIFVNGFMLDQWLAQDNNPTIPSCGPGCVPLPGDRGRPNPNYRPYPTNEISTGDYPQYLGKDFSYWGDIDKKFMTRFVDFNNIYVSGSNQSTSEASERYDAGIKSGLEIVQKIQSGEIKLADEETIKIVSHSQGGAHAAGMAYALNWAYEEGLINNEIEQIYYLAPFEPTEFETPEGIFAQQYSRESDALASKGPLSNKPISGGSIFGKIKGLLDENFIKLKDMDTERGGHNVGTFDEIFDIKKGDKGYVKPSN